MPLWATLYLIVIAGLSGWAVLDDIRQGDSRLRVTADAVAILILGYLFAGHFVRDIAEPLGRAAAPLFIAAFLWTGVAAQREITEEEHDPELSPRANFLAEHLGILVGVALFSPLIAFAGLVAYQLW